MKCEPMPMLPSIIGGRLRVRYEAARMPRLPENLHGLKILHMSDLHAHDEKAEMDLIERLWQVTRELDFHMAVITGDVILDQPLQIRHHIPWIKAVAKKAPVFYVEGNHDLYGYAEIKETMEDAGVIVLGNQMLSYVLHSFGHIKLVGVRDYLFQQANRFAGIDSLFRRGRGEFRLILSHQPQFFDRIKEYGPFLLLAGHTHGGQVRLPFCPTLYAPGQGLLPKYGDGWYKYGDCQMYISRGIGTTLFPIRLFNPPEISIVTLLKE